MSLNPPHGWSIGPLGTLADYQNGYGFAPEQWAERGLPIVRIENMRDPDADANFYEGILPDRFKVVQGDLLFSWSATLMTLIWDRPPAWVNQHIFKVVPRPGVDQSYLHHLLDASLDRLAAWSHGTTMKHVTRKDLLPFEVWVPPFPEQRAIGRILDTIDEAILSTERLIEKLEYIRHGALADVLTRGVDTNGTLRDPSRQPHEFAHTQLGLLPGGWPIEPLGTRLIGIDAGDSPDVPDRPASTGEWGVLKVSAVRPSGFQAHENKAVTDMFVVQTKNEIHEGDLLITRANTPKLVGLACTVTGHPQRLLLSDKTLRLNVNRNMTSPAFACFLLQTHVARAQIEVSGTGSSGSMKNISQSEIRALLLPWPSPEEQQRILERLTAISESIDGSKRERHKLELLKRGLTEDLLSGRIRVSSHDEDAA